MRSLARDTNAQKRAPAISLNAILVWDLIGTTAEEDAENVLTLWYRPQTQEWEEVPMTAPPDGHATPATTARTQQLRQGLRRAKDTRRNRARQFEPALEVTLNRVIEKGGAAQLSGASSRNRVVVTLPTNRGGAMSTHVEVNSILVGSSWGRVTQRYARRPPRLV